MRSKRIPGSLNEYLRYGCLTIAADIPYFQVIVIACVCLGGFGLKRSFTEHVTIFFTQSVT